MATAQAGTSAMSQALHAAEVTALCNVVLSAAGLTTQVKTLEEASGKGAHAESLLAWCTRN